MFLGLEPLPRKNAPYFRTGMIKLDNFRFFARRIKPRAKSQRGLQLDIIHVSWRFVADAVKFIRDSRLGYQSRSVCRKVVVTESLI